MTASTSGGSTSGGSTSGGSTSGGSTSGGPTSGGPTSGGPTSGGPTSGGATGGGTPREGEVVERDVEQLRAELGDTVEELVHRVDVPQRLREKRAEATERVQAQVTHAREVVAEKAPAIEDAVRQRPLVVGGVIAALLLLWLRSLRRRRAHRKEATDGTR